MKKEISDKLDPHLCLHKLYSFDRVLEEAIRYFRMLGWDHESVFLQEDNDD